MAWTVRGIYADYVGWFDGNPTTISPLPPAARAAKMLEMAGGADGMLARARQALEGCEFQWAAELTDYVLAIDAATTRSANQSGGFVRARGAAGERHGA